mgnify:CR=1 FL=1
MGSSIVLEIEGTEFANMKSIFDHQLLDIIADLKKAGIQNLTGNSDTSSQLESQSWEKRMSEYKDILEKSSCTGLKGLIIQDHNLGSLKKYDQNISIDSCPINSGLLDFVVILYHSLKDITQKLKRGIHINLALPERIFGIEVYNIIKVICEHLGLPQNSISPCLCAEMAA